MTPSQDEIDDAAPFSIVENAKNAMKVTKCLACNRVFWEDQKSLVCYSFIAPIPCQHCNVDEQLNA